MRSGGNSTRSDDKRLKPVEALVYITLLSIARERKARNLPMGVTVSELSKRLNRSDSAIRATLKFLKEKGLVKAKSWVYGPLYGLKSKGREKIWLPKHGVDDEEIKQILKEHPEIIEIVGSEEIKELLGIDFEEEHSEAPAILRGQMEQYQTQEVSIDKIIDETFEEWKRSIEDSGDEDLMDILSRPELEGLIKSFGKAVIEKYRSNQIPKYTNGPQ